MNFVGGRKIELVCGGLGLCLDNGEWADISGVELGGTSLSLDLQPEVLHAEIDEVADCVSGFLSTVLVGLCSLSCLGNRVLILHDSY